MDAWGKFDESSGRFHRLEHHCADVAACFEALLRDPVLRTRFVHAAGGPTLFTDTTAARLAYLAFLHDFAKLNVGFQFKVRQNSRAPRPAGHIGPALFALDRADICKPLGLHEAVDAWGEGLCPLLYAVLAHHGRPARRPNRTGSGPADWWMPFEGYDPLATAKLLGQRAREWFPAAFDDGPDLPDSPALAHLFAGIVTLADQLGSDEEAFPYEPDADPDYMERARRIASDTVSKKGFRRRNWAVAPATPNGAADVRALFDYIEPRPPQRAVIDAPLNRPLIVLESETGSGKTEAAVLRFAALWRAGIVDGLYFAVPTRAAARQLHHRITQALMRLFPAGAHGGTVLAVPGYLLVDDVEGRRGEGFDVFWEDEPDDENARLARWSAESARKFLSSAAAVGTVDQVLLAGLQVKWAHFRGASLSRSLLVVDEVHASDSYMTQLLYGVLRAHLDLGGHAMLMSATLGAAARSKLTSSSPRFSPPAFEDAANVPYPALTLVSNDSVAETRSITTGGPSKAVSMTTKPILGDPVSIAEEAAGAARNGARVLVIRNTVASAQAVFRALLDSGAEDMLLEVNGGPALHHSRFAAEDRKLLDDAVEKTIGKRSSSSTGVVVLGTQTLEQSLDIDADFLVTDLCPVDVLLQRIGRLHRHEKTGRPRAFENPQCLVLVPDAGLEAGLDGGLLKHGLGLSDHGGIYRDLVVLEATRRLIPDPATWTIPAMNRMLVERATHPEPLRKLAKELGGPWTAHSRRVAGLHAAEAGVARIGALTRDEPFDEALVFPDSEERVRTRLGEDGPRIELEKPVTGPFGAPVQTFSLPAHLFRSGFPTKEEIEAAQAAPGLDGCLTLQIGAHRLPYDRTGVARPR